MNRLLAIAGKELRHLTRDVRSLAVALLMPAAMVMLYGYAVDMELRRLPVAVADDDRSASSRELVREFTAGGFIVATMPDARRDDIEPAFRRGEIRAAVVIPAGFERDKARQGSGQVQFLIDGSDAVTAATVENYLNECTLRLNRRAAQDRGISRLPLEPSVKVFFNPQLVSAHFIVPGLMAVVLMMVGALLTSIAVAREKETGTLDMLRTTPVAPLEVAIGKLLPYLGLGALDALLVVGVGRGAFGVPLEGSAWALAAWTLLYLALALSLGLAVSAFAPTQQVAMMGALMATLLPTLLLSGFVFPVSSMPPALRVVSRFIPATYFLTIIRGVMLKGRNWYPTEGAVMTAMTALVMVAAVWGFQRKAR